MATALVLGACGPYCNHAPVRLAITRMFHYEGAGVLVRALVDVQSYPGAFCYGRFDGAAGQDRDTSGAHECGKQ